MKIFKNAPFTGQSWAYVLTSFIILTTTIALCYSIRSELDGIHKYAKAFSAYAHANRLGRLDKKICAQDRRDESRNSLEKLANELGKAEVNAKLDNLFYFKFTNGTNFLEKEQQRFGSREDVKFDEIRYDQKYIREYSTPQPIEGMPAIVLPCVIIAIAFIINCWGVKIKNCQATSASDNMITGLTTITTLISLILIGLSFASYLIIVMEIAGIGSIPNEYKISGVLLATVGSWAGSSLYRTSLELVTTSKK